LAFNRPARQISDFNGFGAYMAVDDWSLCAVADSERGRQPGVPAWWQVDLLYPSRVTSVNIQAPFNDTFQYNTDYRYLDGFIITVSNHKSVDSGSVCYSYCNASGQTSLTPGVLFHLPCSQPLSGRYVTIRRAFGGYRPTNLCMCQVQVMGVTLSGNCAAGKPTRQYFKRGGSSSDLAVDLDADRSTDFHVGSCSFTDSGTGLRDPNPGWWQVDLLANYRVTRVNIAVSEMYEAIRFFQYLTVTVDESNTTNSNQECYRYDRVTPEGERLLILLNLTCTRPLTGRYVTIKRYNGSNIYKLALCDVQVIGEYVSDGTIQDASVSQTVSQSNTALFSTASTTSMLDVCNARITTATTQTMTRSTTTGALTKTSTPRQYTSNTHHANHPDVWLIVVTVVGGLAALIFFIYFLILATYFRHNKKGSFSEDF